MYENSSPEIKVRKFGSLSELKAAGSLEGLPASATPAGAGSALCIARTCPYSSSSYADSGLRTIGRVVGRRVGPAALHIIRANGSPPPERQPARKHGAIRAH